MLFSPIGQYALRIMVAVAEAPAQQPVRSKDLAKLTGVPAAYLSKVCRRLTAAGLLTSRKGHHGGFCLALPATEICFADVLTAVDALPETGLCAFGWGECASHDPCPLHEHYSELANKVQRWAENAVLADVKEINPPQ